MTVYAPPPEEGELFECSPGWLTTSASSSVWSGPSAGRELRIASRYTGLIDGESIAVNGACLTVREHGAGWFTVAAVVTTLDRTTIGDVGRRAGA